MDTGKSCVCKRERERERERERKIEASECCKLQDNTFEICIYSGSGSRDTLPNKISFAAAEDERKWNEMKFKI